MKYTLAILAVAIAAVVALSVSSLLSRSGQAAGEQRVYTALGVANVQGERAFVHVAVAVAPGQDERAAAEAALREQGARPATARDLQSDDYTFSGLVWDEFSDANGSNDFVTQSYNPSGDPTGGGESALLASQGTWTNVASSFFAFQYGGQTSRCPSLVRECQGPQRYDNNNDVAWLPLSGCCTLGVTWYSTSRDEADMAMNTNFAWHTGCTDLAGSYDAQTVFTHENGHVVGLGHSSIQQALMYAYYSGAHCGLHQDDIDGISALYPEGDPPPPANTPLPTATPTSTNTPDPNAPTATPTPCPAGWYRNGRC